MHRDPYIPHRSRPDDRGRTLVRNAVPDPAILIVIGMRRGQELSVELPGRDFPQKQARHDPPPAEIASLTI